tara:strand:+ start:1486 stop:1911 length:426 start_codon:yes stop_codon:yes gene_type:complete
MIEKVVEASLEDLPLLAKEIMETFSNELVFAFRGDLGAGKTTLIKNICNFLGVKEAVSSPTFSLVNEYLTEENQVIYHFDFYRLESEEEAYDIGFEDYLSSENRCFIEWPEKIESLLPERRVEIEILEQGTKRKLIIKQLS